MTKTRKLDNEKTQKQDEENAKSSRVFVIASSFYHRTVLCFLVFVFVFSCIGLPGKMRIQQFSILCRNDTVYGLSKQCSLIEFKPSMDSSTNFQAPPRAAYFLWSCDKVYHKQEVCFLLYFLGRIVSWQYNPNLLD